MSGPMLRNPQRTIAVLEAALEYTIGRNYLASQYNDAIRGALEQGEKIVKARETPARRAEQ